MVDQFQGVGLGFVDLQGIRFLGAGLGLMSLHSASFKARNWDWLIFSVQVPGCWTGVGRYVKMWGCKVQDLECWTTCGVGKVVVSKVTDWCPGVVGSKDDAP